MSNTQKYRLYENINHVLSVITLFSFLAAACFADAENMIPLVLLGLLGVICGLVAFWTENLSVHYKEVAIRKNLREKQRSIMMEEEYSDLVA